MPIPLSASALHIRDAAGLSLPSVKPCENTPQPFTGPSGTSRMPESSSPVVPSKETFSERDTVSPFIWCEWLWAHGRRVPSASLRGQGADGEENDDGAAHRAFSARGERRRRTPLSAN